MADKQVSSSSSSASVPTVAGVSGNEGGETGERYTVTKAGVDKARAKVRALIGPCPEAVLQAEKRILSLGKDVKVMKVDLASKLAEKEALVKKNNYSLTKAVNEEIEELEMVIKNLEKSRYAALKIIQEYNAMIYAKLDLPSVLKRFLAEFEERKKAVLSVMDLVDNFVPTPLPSDLLEDMLAEFS